MTMNKVVIVSYCFIRTSRRLQCLPVYKPPSAKQASRRAITVGDFYFNGFVHYRQGQRQVTLSVSHANASNTTNVINALHIHAKKRVHV